MTQARMNIYGFTHKGLRNVISQLLITAGHTNYSDGASLERMKALALEACTLLELHGHAEESIVLAALEAKVPGSTADNIEEHVHIDKEVESLKHQAAHFNESTPPLIAGNFYHNVANFYSTYLAHMAMEETVMNKLIWANFTDPEIMVQQGQVMSVLTPDQVWMWYKYIVPALNPIERTVIMAGFKAKAPAPVFESILAALAKYMDKEDHKNLVNALG